MQPKTGVPTQTGYWLAALLILGSPALVVGAFFAPFIRYDDEKILLENPIVTEGLTASALEKIGRPPVFGYRGYYGQYAPVLYLSLGLQYKITGPVAWTYRAGNLLFHFGSAMLLFGIACRLMPSARRLDGGYPTRIGTTPEEHRQPICAALGAAFFFFHPTCVEVTAWAAERNLAQSTFFGLLAWWILLSPNTLTLRRGLLACFVFTVALLTKATAIGLGPVIILSVLFFRGETKRVRWGWSLALGGLCALMIWFALGQGSAGFKGLTGGSYLNWALTSFGILGRYLANAVWPSSLSFFYGIDAMHASEFSDPWILLTPLVLLGYALVLWWVPIGKARLFVLGAGALAALLPTMSPHTIYFLMQDRYLYVALAVIAVLFAQMGEALSYRLKFIPEVSAPPLFRAAVIFFASLCFCLGGLSYLRSNTFRSSEALFRDAARKQPQSFYANFFLAKEILVHTGRMQGNLPGSEFKALLSEALPYVEKYRKAVDRERKPTESEENLVTGEIFFWMGMEEQAAEELTQAVALESEGLRRDLAYAHWLLAEIAKKHYFSTQENAFQEEFYTHMRWILGRFPEDGYALICLGDFQERIGKKDEARKAFERAARNPAYTSKAEAALERLKKETIPNEP